MDAPAWLEHPSLRRELEKIIGKLNSQPAARRTQSIYVKIGPSTFPPLFSPAEPGDDEILWTAIDKACGHGAFEFRPGKHRASEPAYVNGRLEFNFNSEEQLRVWLNMPTPSTMTPWFHALQGKEHALNSELLLKSPIVVNGKQPEEIIEALLFAREELSSGISLTLRQIAARYLWSDSKAIDTRDATWLAQVLRVPDMCILPRTIHVSVHCVCHAPNSLLFIENQDTFDMYCQRQELVGSVAVIFLSGFKATAGRIRQQGAAQLFFSTATPPEAQQWVRDNWFSNIAVSCSIWTDLDFAGLSIAIALRRSFERLEWHDSAYRLMLMRLHKGQGHSFDSKHKGKQKEPDVPALWGHGRAYLDQMRQYQCFVDQECILLAELT